MQGVRSNDTKPELALRRELHRRGRRYRVHATVEAGGRRCKPDIVFPGEQLAVFVDGCRWHCCPEHFRAPRVNAEYWNAKFARNVARDRLTDEALALAGWRVVRVWEHEDPRAAADRVEHAWSASRHPPATGGR